MPMPRPFRRQWRRRTAIAAAALLATCGPAQAAAADAGKATGSDLRWIAELGLHLDARPVRERAGWRPPRVILLGAGARERLASLRKIAPDARFVDVSDPVPPHEVASADAAIGVCDPDLIARAPKLAWIQLLSAGVERCVRLTIVRQRRPLLTNMQRVYGPAMAEHVFALLLSFTRSLQALRVGQERRTWLSDDDLPRL